jgi:hypothetical protein
MAKATKVALRSGGGTKVAFTRKAHEGGLHPEVGMKVAFASQMGSGAILVKWVPPVTGLLAVEYSAAE